MGMLEFLPYFDQYLFWYLVKFYSSYTLNFLFGKNFMWKLIKCTIIRRKKFIKSNFWFPGVPNLLIVFFLRKSSRIVEFDRTEEIFAQSITYLVETEYSNIILYTLYMKNWILLFFCVLHIYCVERG